MPKLEGYAKSKASCEWDLLRNALKLKIGDTDLTQISNEIARCHVKRGVEDIDKPKYDTIRRFLLGETLKPSNGLIEYLYQYVFKSTRDAYWDKQAVLIFQKPPTTLLPETWKDAYLWYANASSADEIKVQTQLKTELTGNQSFMQIMNDLVTALKRGVLETDTQADESALCNMATIRDSQSPFFTYCDYKFYHEKTTWINIKTQENQSIKADILFAHYASAILKKRIQKWGELSRESYMSDFLGIETDSVYQPIILLAAFKANIEIDDSVEYMACYPSYDNEFTELTDNQYIMTSRTWWQDAFDANRRKQLDWQMTTRNTQSYISLSRPFPSVRKNSPNERGLSFDIDLKNTAFPNGKLILSIQFARKAPI
jgi:hypothetical protein